MKCPNKRHKDWISLVSSHGETGAYHEYVKNNFEIPTVRAESPHGVPYLTIEEKIEEVGNIGIPISEYNFANDTVSSSQVGNIAIELANKIATMTGVNIKIVTSKEVSEIHEIYLPGSIKPGNSVQIGALWDRTTRTAFIPTVEFQWGAVIHEAFMHPFLDYIKVRHNTLYKSLIERAKAMPDIDKEVKELYSTKLYELGEEHATFAMDAYFRKREVLNKSKGPIDRLFRAIEEVLRRMNVFIRDVFGLNDLSKLSNNITFGQLYDIIKYSDAKYDIISQMKNTSGVSARRIINKETAIKDVAGIRKLAADKTAHMQYTDSIHEYRNMQTGEVYTSVTTIKKDHGYGDEIDPSQRSDSFDAFYTLASEVGTTIHDMLDADVKGVSFNPASKERYKGMSPSGIQDIKRINKLIGKSSKLIASEMMVVDDDTRISGMVDRIVSRNSNGEVVQLDFKTKIINTYDADGKSLNKNQTGNDYMQFRNYHRTKYENSKPDRSKHDFQQTMYKRMMEIWGVDVAKKGIIPLEVVLRHKKDGSIIIDSVRISKLLPLDNELPFYNLITNNAITESVDAVFGLTKIGDDVAKEVIMAELTPIIERGMQVLKSRAASLGMQRKSVQKDEIVSDLATSGTGNMIYDSYAIIQAANKVISRYMKTYKDTAAIAKIQGPGVWDFKAASEWRQFALAINDTLRDLRIFYQDNPEYFKDVEGLDVSQFGDLIDELNTQKDILISAYDTKLRPLWIETFAKRTKQIEYNYRKAFQLKYKQDWKSSHPKTEKFDSKQEALLKIAEDQYIKDNTKAIEVATRQFIGEQADIADYDTNFFYRWAGTIYDTSDAVIGVNSKIYYDKMMESNDIHRNWRTRLANLMNEFDAANNTSSFQNQQAVYDYMLEYRADGSTHLINHIPDSFNVALNEKKKSIAELFKTATAKVRGRELGKWLDMHAPYVKNAKELIKDDRLELFLELYDIGALPESDYNALRDNEKLEYPLPMWELREAGLISMDSEWAVSESVSDINWSYRMPDKTLFPHSKWDALNALPETDVNRKLYDTFTYVQRWAKAVVPERFKIGSQLPGVRKDLQDRIVAGQNIGDLLKESIKDVLTVTTDDDQRGLIGMTDELGNPLNFIPVHYTQSLPVSDQSFDLPMIFSMYYKSVLQYTLNSDILPTLDFTKHIVDTRKTRKRNSAGKRVVNKLAQVWNGENLDDDGIDTLVNAEETYLAEQLNDWMKQAIYMQREKDMGTIMGVVDVHKLLKTLQAFSSFKIMGFNLLSMVNNATMAETSQIVEVASGSLMSASTYAKASLEYTKHLGGIIGDMGSRRFSSKVNIALEYFNLFDERNQYDEYKDKSIVKRLFKSSAFYVTTQLGEHSAQGRFLIGALMEVEVFGHNGESLGSLWDNLTVDKDGIMGISQQVSGDMNSLRNSISRKVTQTIREMHGNYTDYTTTAMAANGYLALIQQFRKWVIPGMQRRWARGHFSEFSEMEKLGYFRGGGIVAKNMMQHQYYNFLKFFGQTVDEAKAAEIAIKADWDMLSTVEKQSAKKLMMDASIYGMMFAMFGLLSLAHDDDEFKDSSDIYKALVNNMMYQTYRLNLEQTSYINPLEAKQILQSPAAGVSVFEGLVDVITQLKDPTARYTSGARKNDLKIAWKTFNNIPVVRQLYRVAHSDDALTALSR